MIQGKRWWLPKRMRLNFFCLQNLKHFIWKNKNYVPKACYAYFVYLLQNRSPKHFMPFSTEMNQHNPCLLLWRHSQNWSSKWIVFQAIIWIFFEFWIAQSNGFDWDWHFFTWAMWGLLCKIVLGLPMSAWGSVEELASWSSYSRNQICCTSSFKLQNKRCTFVPTGFQLVWYND